MWPLVICNRTGNESRHAEAEVNVTFHFANRISEWGTEGLFKSSIVQ